MSIRLNAAELAALFQQDPKTRSAGGFQGLLVGLQDGCDKVTGVLTVSAKQRLRIRNYAFNCGRGGWQNRLIAMFGRHFGPQLDRN